MVSFRRKTTENNADSTALIPSGDADQSKDAYNKGKKDTSKNWAHEMTEWVVVFIVCFSGFYFFTFGDHERAHHKKQMDAQLQELAKQFEAQKTSLTSQLDGLYQQLFAAQETTKEAIQQAEAAVSPAEAAAPPAEAAPAQAAPVAVSAEEQRLQAEIDRKKAELEQRQKKIASFCDWCSFNHGGLQTTCGARRDYLIDNYGDSPEAAVLAVMGWDPACSSIKN
mmetsp:Transcript_4886/g.9314  ORF Transcript_4886/g.9314 Transcript_4886/m.9314 type:complete len:224 (+) Transcript_4886:93-764(+)|eukprot:scaffold6961_cov227-Amphora_coffeaeformis.AAC.3